MNSSECSVSNGDIFADLNWRALPAVAREEVNGSVVIVT